MMKKLPTWIWSAAAVPLALIAGIVIGRSGSTSETPEDETTGIPSRSIPGRSGAINPDGSPVAARGKSSTGSSSEFGDTELTAILDGSTRLERTQRLLAFLDRLPDGEFGSVYAEISNSPLSEVRSSERSLILQAWAERDPHAAVAYLESNDAQDWERETTLGTWASLDPNGAFAWASEAEDNGRINNWQLGALRGIASTDPELARVFLNQMEDGRTRERAVDQMQAYVSSMGFDYAEKWISGLDDSDLANRAARRFADNLADLDVQRAGQWISSIEDTGTRRDASQTVSERWARQDLDAARSWVEDLPDDTRSEAAEGVARHYAREDADAAASWLANLGSGEDYDGARQVLIREAYRQDPASSMGYISSIVDERDRNRSYDRYLRDWIRRDEAAARSWAQNNQAMLPERVVNRYLGQGQ